MIDSLASYHAARRWRARAMNILLKRWRRRAMVRLGALLRSEFQPSASQSAG